MESAPALLTTRPAPQEGGLRGFTLVELIVVVSIMAILTTIILAGQSSFNRSILVTNTAYTIALSLRQAQSLGLSSRQYVSGGSIYESAGYGIHVLRTATLPAANSYVVYADIGGTSPVTTPTNNCPPGTPGSPEAKPGNCRYDAGLDGVLQTYKLERGFLIRTFCGVRTSNGSTYCSDADDLRELNIVFRRPNTETIMAGNLAGSWIQLSGAAIYVSSPDQAAVRGICISSVGQVSVSLAGTCP